MPLLAPDLGRVYAIYTYVSMPAYVLPQGHAV